MNAQALGITCPTCSTLLDQVLFTRKAAGQILRVRKCQKCRQRWRTGEVIIAGRCVERGEEKAAEEAALGEQSETPPTAA